MGAAGKHSVPDLRYTIHNFSTHQTGAEGKRIFAQAFYIFRDRNFTQAGTFGKCMLINTRYTFWKCDLLQMGAAPKSGLTNTSYTIWNFYNHQFVFETKCIRTYTGHAIFDPDIFHTIPVIEIWNILILP